MPARSLPNLGLQAFFDLGEDGWNDEMDNNMLRLSVLVQAGAISKVATLPGSPSNGDIYILDATASVNPNTIAFRDNGVWQYLTPLEGWLIYNRATDQYESFNGTTWTVLQTGGGGGGGALPYAGARVRRSTITVASTTGVWTPFQWDIETRDTLNFWGPANPSRMTIPAGVTKIRLMGFLQIDPSDTAANNQFTFRKNGSDFFNGRVAWNLGSGGYNNPSAFGVSDVIDVATGDYFEFVYLINESLAITTESFFAIEVVERSLANVGLNLNLGEILDVNLSDPIDGQAIVYREDTDDWGAGLPVTTANTILGMNKPFRGAMAILTDNRLSSSSPTTVSWDSIDFDTDGFWSAASPTRLSIPLGTGITKVRLSATLSPTSTDLGDEHLLCSFLKNGTNFRGNGAIGYEIGYTDVGVSITSPVVPVVEGDYFELYFNSPDTSRTWAANVSHFSLEVVEVIDPWLVNGSNITPVIKGTNIQSSNASSYVVPFPTGTSVNDFVIIFGIHGWPISTPAGWALLDAAGTTSVFGRTFAKQITSADLAVGNVTITTTNAFEGLFSAITIDGNSLDSISSIESFQSSSGVSSTNITMPFSSISDRVLLFAGNRGASNNTLTSAAPPVTTLRSLNSTNASAIVAQTVSGRAFTSCIANYSTPGTGYYNAAVNLKSRPNIEISKNTYNIPFGFTGRPTGNEILLLHVFTENVTFKRNWQDSRGNIGTNSTGTVAFNIRRNGTSVGTITVQPSGAIAFESSNTITFVIGDVLSVIAPASADATLANSVFTIRGTKVTAPDGIITTGSGIVLTPPIPTNFPTTIGTPTLAYSSTSLLISNIANGSGLSGVTRSTSGSVTLTGKFQSFGLENFNSTGLCMSNGTRFLTVGHFFGNAVRTSQWDNRTAFGSEPIALDVGIPGITWFRMIFDSGTGQVTSQVSATGDNWITVQSNNSWLSTGGVTSVGFVINRNNTTISPAMWVESFQIT